MQEREAAGVLRDTAAIRTPFYVVDETLLKKNLEILKDTAERAGCRILLAQKAFSMYSVYPLIRQYLSGTAASGLYEARLGKTEFGGETHVFSAAYRLPEPVRIGASAGSGRSGGPGDLCQHAGRSGGVPRDVQEKAI